MSDRMWTWRGGFWPEPPSCALCGEEIELPATAPRRGKWLYCSPRCHRDDGWGAQIVRAVRKGWKPRTKRIALRRNQCQANS